jgi:hypothetical protein
VSGLPDQVSRSDERRPARQDLQEAAQRGRGYRGRVMGRRIVVAG